MEVMRRIRTFSDCYVLITTARSEEVDRLVGLSVGADDYLTKPFSVRELVARVQAVLRRPRADSGSASSDTVRTFGELEIDTAAQEVRLASRPLPLTPTERGLLMTLALSPGQAFSRRQLMEAVWGDSWLGDDHLVDVHIANLRRKLDETAESARFVTTVRGIGFLMGNGLARASSEYICGNGSISTTLRLSY